MDNAIRASTRNFDRATSHRAVRLFTIPALQHSVARLRGRRFTGQEFGLGRRLVRIPHLRATPSKLGWLQTVELNTNGGSSAPGLVRRIGLRSP